MQYEKMSEKVPVAPMQTSHPAGNQDFRQNSDIRRTRVIVLVLLGIQLVFALFYFIGRCVELGRYYNIPLTERDKALAGPYIGNIIASAISVVYLIIFFIIVFKYLRIGILIFAWLGLIQLILILIIIIFAIVAIVAVSAVAHAAGVGIIVSVVIIVIAAIACILTILTVIFSFKLAKLIKMHEAYHYV